MLIILTHIYYIIHVNTKWKIQNDYRSFGLDKKEKKKTEKKLNNIFECNTNKST